MQVQVSDAITQTVLFIALICVILLFSIRRKKDPAILPISLTNEMKGLAILGIIFAHIGYYLSTDTLFLFPLSVSAGMGVNLFLFLSGYGLTLSELRHPLNPVQFYFRRLKRIYLPMWLVISLFLLLDFFILGKSYQVSTVIGHYLGFFPKADLFQNLDSPLWYFTLILFYYLVFPLLFWKRLFFISPILIYLLSFFLLKLPLPIDPGVFSLYQLHLIAFPLGVAFGLLVSGKSGQYLQKILSPLKKIQSTSFIPKVLVQIILLIPLLLIFGYTSLHSGVGQGSAIEQRTSLLTMTALIAVFALKRVRFALLELFGVYSYEIYLLHWPIVYRYDFLYKFLPAGVATILYLGIFLGLGYLLKLLVDKLLTLFS